QWGVYEDNDATAGAPVAHLRPHACALAALVDELAGLVDDGVLSIEEAGEAYHQARGQVRALFAGAIFNAKATPAITGVTRDGRRIELHFLRQAAVGFLGWLLAVRA